MALYSIRLLEMLQKEHKHNNLKDIYTACLEFSYL